jgi:hypothetical protein
MLKCSTRSTDLIVHELAGVILLEQLDESDDIRVLHRRRCQFIPRPACASNVTYGVIKRVVRAVAADDEHASSSRSGHLAAVRRGIGVKSPKLGETALYDPQIS